MNKIRIAMFIHHYHNKAAYGIVNFGLKGNFKLSFLTVITKEILFNFVKPTHG